MATKKRKIWIPVTALILVAAAVAAYFMIPKEPQKEVTVYPFSMVGYTGYFSGGSESYGVVTTDRVQTAYVSDTQKVTEIKVYQGQQVKKGEVLYLYDTTLSDLELERKQLSIEQMELNLKTAQAELKALQAMKPMVLRDQPETNKTDNTKIPSNAREGVIYNSGGKGTQTNPYYVWLRSGTRITEDMINTYLDKANPVCVVFRIASQAGTAYTQEFGVRYEMTQEAITGTGGGISPASEDEPTVAAQEESVPEESTAAESPPDPSEPSSEPTDPTEVTTQPTEPPEPEKILTMSFFTPGDLQQENVGDEIIWNSGYTSSELQTMRTEKEDEIEELQFSIKMGKAELEIMKKEADNGQVTAQFDGIVTSVLEPDTASAMDAPMIKVAGGGGFYVEGSVSELDLADIQVGQKVTVTSWDSYMTFEGTIAEIGSYPVEDGGNYYYGSSNVSFYPYKVFIEETADLQEGGYVSLVYQSGSTEDEGTMYLENAFLRTENGESFVYVRGEDDKLEKRIVQTGESTDGYSTQIFSGLSETDYLAFPYGNEVQEGAPTAEGSWEDLYGY